MRAISFLRAVLCFVNIPLEQTLSFGSADVHFYIEGSEQLLHREVSPENTIILTDQNVADFHPSLFEGYRTIIVPAGEGSKSLETLAYVAQECLRLGADRKTLLVGIGGGVVTDLTGFVASVFMRGLPFAFAPTTLLAMVDAAWGGKNGINLGEVKNVLGVIRQPRFVMHLPHTLATLPASEWSSAFAEIIKYGCICAPEILSLLEAHDLAFFRETPAATATLAARCVELKSQFVEADEHETDIRRHLNFGHTLGHAIERQCDLSHGAAVGLGMLFAARISAQLTGLSAEMETRIEALLQRYGLPIRQKLDIDQALWLMADDKKRESGHVRFALLSALGEATTRMLSLEEIRAFLQNDPRWM